ncbi:MAG: DUF3501 family protein [Nitrosomonadales bacterium]|jgi:hypothetical protein|nr:MAG: DUF3501 family protein [Nitrosomonadales bacterium]
MPKITRDSIMALETYAKARQEFRAQVMLHKKIRKVYLGEDVTLIFEDELTIRYQIQEMLRAEKIFEEQGIIDEIEAYRALVPDGGNWKATMMIEYPDPIERADKLTKLIDIEKKIWVGVGGYEPVYAIADEDLARATEEKTSAVHFLRFELTQNMVKALRKDAPLSMGIDHPNYQVLIEQVDRAVRSSLINDLAN